MPSPRADRTQERLLQAAIAAFKKDGFHGTDSNRIARAAVLAAGTFYRHFEDKRAAFLAACTRFADEEHSSFVMALEGPGSAQAIASRLVMLLGTVHRNWRGLPAQARSLAASDAKVRELWRKQRARLLDLIAARRRQRAPGPRDALLLLTLEAGCDALSEDDKGLRVDRTALGAELQALAAQLLGS